MAIPVADGGLRTRAPERGAWRQDEQEVFVRLPLIDDAPSRGQEARELQDRRTRLPVAERYASSPPASLKRSAPRRVSSLTSVRKSTVRRVRGCRFSCLARARSLRRMRVCPHRSGARSVKPSEERTARVERPPRRRELWIETQIRIVSAKPARVVAHGTMRSPWRARTGPQPSGQHRAAREIDVHEELHVHCAAPAPLALRGTMSLREVLFLEIQADAIDRGVGQLRQPLPASPSTRARST